ncbi:hypothetical protein MJO28_005599 [Puccinia striiformis f. sp. tritici]|uniref:Uncharacterized protein n=1 Tax=Puccinia striiformis f. sp. tritici TaxID=168172 RepID=A0ACC0EL76_9BASI|nr:hypothetical protein MJO28_005599 [Puccinia striiformis f. sp. tritici]
MALNCSMITPNNDPVPLPGEKIFISVKSVTIYLNPTTPGAGTTSEPAISPTTPTSDPKQKGKLSLSGILSAITLNGPSNDGSANGTVYVTNQRILFIADNPSTTVPDPPLPVQPSTITSEGQIPNPLPEIKTLTVPLRNSFDGRFIQPWLSANYHLSTFIPVPNGHLDQFLPSHNPQARNSQSAQDSFTLKIIFNEGHGFEFSEALEEVKNFMFQSDSQRPAELEELPTYSPPMGEPLPLENVGSSSQAAGLESQQGVGTTTEDEELPPPSIDGYDARHCARRNTVPEADLLFAASIATEEELQEREFVTEEPPLTSLSGSPQPTPASIPPSGTDAPPGYEP